MWFVVCSQLSAISCVQSGEHSQACGVQAHAMRSGLALSWLCVRGQAYKGGMCVVSCVQTGGRGQERKCKTTISSSLGLLSISRNCKTTLIVVLFSLKFPILMVLVVLLPLARLFRFVPRSVNVFSQLTIEKKGHDKKPPPPSGRRRLGAVHVTFS